MERVSDPVPRRGVLAAAGTGLLLSLLGCDDEAEDPAPSTTVPDGMPTTAVGVLESADLAPPPEETSIQGTAFERMVLVDDADPRTVRVRLSEVR
ncbi:hypothetical protein Y09_2583 [Brachybacterium sp. SW0106-09]|nr:hypothetical protein Y09_2583 [Brachybacterium sp. SW0106-09]